MREEQRGSLPEPCPAGSRARPPWLPPAPPALGERPTGGGGAVPDSVRELYRAFHRTLLHAGALRAFLLGPQQPAHTLGFCLTDPASLAEARERLLARIAELRARLLLGNDDLSDPLLRLFQNELLGLSLSNGPHQRLTGDPAGAFAMSILRRALGLQEAIDPEWLQYPFPASEPIMRFDRQPAREFLRRLLEETETAVRDPGNYETLECFDREIARRLTAAFAASVAVINWVRANRQAGRGDFL